ncbi:transposase [Xenorhabdus sp. VLS]|uniref:Transposase n=1 Tax=Xenorhabdus lircayensis TaxID=2763499 RepID=A0ABS0U9G3_9GAMM|nr:transposase [Xenorhabdus lircayensis]
MKAFDETRGRYQCVGKSLITLPDQVKYVGKGAGIKAITGGDLIEVDGKYEKQFSTIIKVVVLATNDEPMSFTERNGGIARRRGIFPFNIPVKESEKDPLLSENLFTISRNWLIIQGMRKIYPSDITHEQFAAVQFLLENVRKITKPCTVELYDVFCGVLYALKTGCQWRALPSDYPKWETVYSYFAKWKKPDADGVSVLELALKKADITPERSLMCYLINFKSSFLCRFCS